MDIGAILDAAELPRTSVTLCLKGTLVAKYERIDEQLRALAPAASLAGDGGSNLAAQMDELRAQMLAHEATFTFEALPARGFSDLRATMPEKTDEQSLQDWQDLYHHWVCGLVAITCREPQMTAEEADQLAAKLSDAQWSRLCNAAWRVNANKQDIPFSNAAFAFALTSGGKSKRPEQPEPADPDGSAANPSSGPSTNATSLAG